MNWSGAYIVAGYVAAVLGFGWQGVLAVALHVGLMLLVTRLK
jgi:hypothetical protein